MATDLKLDDGSDEQWVTVDARVLNATSADLMLDHPARRSAGSEGWRRALVHNHEDGLTVNFNGDYPGGCTIVGAQLKLRIHVQSTSEPQLPKHADIGDLFFVRNRISHQHQVVSDECTLWLCVSGMTIAPSALWSQIPLGDPIPGTL